MDEERGREASSIESRDEGRSFLGDGRRREAEVGRTNPTRGDPAILMMADRSSFCCWVESLSDGDRWVFRGPDGKTHIGPDFGREDSLEAIGALLSRWRASNDRIEHHPGEASRVRLPR